MKVSTLGLCVLAVSVSGCWSALNTYSIAPKAAVTVEDIGKAFERSGESVREVDEQLGVVKTKWKVTHGGSGTKDSAPWEAHLRFVAVIMKDGSVTLRAETEMCQNYQACQDKKGQGMGDDQEDLDALAAKMSADLNGGITVIPAPK